MTERRSARPRKRVDYSKLSVDDDSDDDFSCSTPPSGPPQKKRNCSNDARPVRAVTKQEKLITDRSSKTSADKPSPSNSPIEVARVPISPAIIEDKLKPILSTVLKSEKLLEVRHASSEATATVRDDVESANNSPIRPIRQKVGNNDVSKSYRPSSSSSSSECEMDSETLSSEESEADSENFEPKAVKSVKSVSTKLKGKAAKVVASDSEKKAAATPAGRKPMPLKSQIITNHVPEASKGINCRVSHEILTRPQCAESIPQRDSLPKVAAARPATNRIASSGVAGLRLGLSRNARVKSLHPAVKVGPH